MKKLLLPGTALVAVVLAVAGGAFALGAFDDDDGGSRDAADEAKCAADATDCTDPNQVSDGDALGVCAPGVTDCVDTVVNPDGEVSENICVEGAEDCNDTVTSGDDVGDECSVVHNIEVCKGHATEVAFADLEQRIPGQEISVVSVEYTEWPDSSLGNPQPDMAYTQVITPGFKVLLEAGGQQYEYHTDLYGEITAVN